MKSTYGHGMTFYEELGVPPDAATDTIREAYRNVVRLLHPDAQTNPVLKQSAEAQMKRINHVYETLSEADRRRRYDQELAEPPHHAGAIIIQAPVAPDRHPRVDTGSYVWFAAAAICASVIIWLAAREPSASATASGPSVVGPASVSAAPTSTRPIPNAKSNPDRQRDEEIVRLRGELAAANADRERLSKQIASMEAAYRVQPLRQAQLPTPAVAPVPLPDPVAELEVPLPAISLDPIPAPAAPRIETPALAATRTANATRTPNGRWAGNWEYVRPASEKTSHALFPPEFIETVIIEDRGRLRGQYRARYKVADARISPDVTFRFEGNVSGMAGRFLWTGAAGAKGEVKLRLISESTLEVVWTATALGKTMGLDSGRSVLNRRD